MINLTNAAAEAAAAVVLETYQRRRLAVEMMEVAVAMVEVTATEMMQMSGGPRFVGVRLV